MAERHGILLLIAPLLAASGALAQADAGLPPPASGREVVLDSKTFVAQPGERSVTLSDLDPETAEIVREINRKPGTWQMYLLYTAEDLPERMFHPGFAIPLSSRGPKSPPIAFSPQRDDDSRLAPGETIVDRTPASPPLVVPPAAEPERR